MVIYCHVGKIEAGFVSQRIKFPKYEKKQRVNALPGTPHQSLDD